MLNTNSLNKESAETIAAMVEYCLENNIRLGMDGGYRKDDKPRAIRRRLEQFVIDNEDLK